MVDEEDPECFAPTDPELTDKKLVCTTFPGDTNLYKFKKGCELHNGLLQNR